MQGRLIRLFVISAGLLLLITAAAKGISAAGNARVLQVPDPLLGLSFRTLFWLVALFETVVAAVCFSRAAIATKCKLVAWLSTNFLVYRLGLIWVNYQEPCQCLGTLTDSLHIEPGTAALVMKIVLAYLLIGSYGGLLLLRWRKPAQGDLRAVFAGE